MITFKQRYTPQDWWWQREVDCWEFLHRRCQLAFRLWMRFIIAGIIPKGKEV